jgi:hypothetical protein
MGSFLNGAVAVLALFLLQMLFASGDFAGVCDKLTEAREAL